MVIDTSALIAIVLDEVAAPRLSRAIASAPTRLVSAGTLLEASIVALGRAGESGVAKLDATVGGLDLSVVPVDATQVGLARDAFARYGKGRDAAALNFGDCFSCALAIERGEALLFVGNDFSRTNVDVAAY